MPYITLKVSVTPGAELVRTAGAAITELTATVLRKRAELTAVAIEHVPKERWFAGGAPGDAGGPELFSLVVAVTEGTNTKDEKERFIAEAYRLLAKLLGGASRLSYVIIEEVRADSWGYAGETQEYRYITGKQQSRG